MSYDSSNDHGIRVPVYDPERFSLFVAKMRAVTAIEGFVEALDMKFNLKLPAKGNVDLRERESDVSKKAQMEAKVKNAIAVHYLMLSMNEEEHMSIIDDARTDDWPSALACEIWNAVDEENRPNDMLAKAELMKKIMQLKLKKSVSPKKLVEELVALISRYNCKLDNE